MKDNIEIKAPDGYKFKEIKDGNVVFEPIQQLNYYYIKQELFKTSNEVYNITTNIIKDRYKEHPEFSNMELKSGCCFSLKQLEKLTAINRLLNVAKYLNGDWKPDFSDIKKQKFYIFINEGKLDIIDNTFCICGCCYFKTKELAQQAIEILGEDIIKLALTTDY